MQRLHNFMDKMRQKPVAERRKLLMTSTLSVGVLIAIFALWNTSRNLLAFEEGLKSADTELAASAAPSLFSSFRQSISLAWGDVSGELKDLNDKLGSLQKNGQ